MMAKKQCRICGKTKTHIEFYAKRKDCKLCSNRPARSRPDVRMAVDAVRNSDGSITLVRR